MSGGEGVRNPADLTPVLNVLASIEFFLALYLNAILEDIEDVQDSVDVIDGIVDTILVDTTLLLTRLTALRAGYLDELGPTNLPSDIDDLLSDTAAIAHHVDARCRVYPQDVQSTIQLTCAAAANTWGAWTEIVPLGTIGFCYKPTGVQVEEVSAAATFCIQLGYSTADGDDPTTEQIMGERRIKLLGTPIKTVHDKMDFFPFDAPARAKLWGRVKSNSGNADTIDISVVIIRHVPVTNQVAPLTTWPWAV